MLAFPLWKNAIMVCGDILLYVHYPAMYTIIILNVAFPIYCCFFLLITNKNSYFANGSVPVFILDPLCS